MQAVHACCFAAASGMLLVLGGEACLTGAAGHRTTGHASLATQQPQQLRHGRKGMARLGYMPKGQPAWACQHIIHQLTTTVCCGPDQDKLGPTPGGTGGDGWEGWRGRQAEVDGHAEPSSQKVSQVIQAEGRGRRGNTRGILPSSCLFFFFF